ncbi:hypothetical protein AMAG_04004 [Allomyces macrogynus ATCC 38327]|uniref:Uncharacterized protein n=1 Tax=Allomyces macrogynus (strain ATCC 38327) TaxID=578462 RepID=A0A0L0S7U4_ALLM3|nr:hypothetical protein AMAG_04004 [Allomyces macrogynus ATCC 38327]|eukprot:KNE58434.1 hypothetical protein AMAG_04004 [Allomyces macrogynus ATCC 38327]
MFAAGTSDGKIMLCSKGARVDKIMDAHRGAVLSLHWSGDGSALLSGGEDGQVKIWSKTGMLRSLLLTQGTPIFSSSWSPDGTQVLLTANKSLCVKPLQAGSKQNTWKAHDGCVLKVAWNEASSLIVSGGEDKKFKVWDAYGRLMYASPILDHVVTSLAWSPNGDCFTVGSYNSLRVCDRLGWTLATSTVDSGSIYAISWTADGTMFAFATARGHVGFAHLVHRRLEWRHLEVEILDDKVVQVRDTKTGHEDQLDFKDRLMHASVAFHTVVLITSTQCHVVTTTLGQLAVNAFDVPAQLSGRLGAVKQAKSCFAVVDHQNGIVVMAYSGRVLCHIKLARPETVTEALLALNDEVLVVRDPVHEDKLLQFDLSTGRSLGEIQHAHDIRKVDVDHVGLAKHVAIVDKNNDLWLAQLARGNLVKLGGMTESIRFDEETPLLASTMDGRLTFWMFPAVVFVDADLAKVAVRTKEGVKSARILWYAGSQCSLRKTDGSTMVVGWTCPYTRTLHELAARKKWDAGLKICRMAKQRDLWAVLAGLALTHGNELNTAEVAYAAMDDATKVQYICHIRAFKAAELRQAEVLVFKRQFKEAEAVLLAAGMAFWAVRMWVLAHQWDRALDIVQRFKDLLPMVLVKRKEYLARVGLPETHKRFLQLEQTSVDAVAVNGMITAEERKAGLQA